MNEHILLVMKYLDDNNSVTAQELSDNYKAAYAAYIDATAAHEGTAAYVAAFAYAIADDYAAAAYVATYVATATYAAYIYATTATADYAADAKNAIDRYFNFAGENKQDYINEITKKQGRRI